MCHELSLEQTPQYENQATGAIEVAIGIPNILLDQE
jgi:hypothetical protein